MPSSAGLRELRAAGISYAVVDALDESDLRTIGRACADLPLVTGGAGVALGLPDNFRRAALLPGHDVSLAAAAMCAGRSPSLPAAARRPRRSRCGASAMPTRR